MALLCSEAVVLVPSPCSAKQKLRERVVVGLRVGRKGPLGEACDLLGTASAD